MQKDHLRNNILIFQLISILLLGLTVDITNSELTFEAEENNYSIILMIGDGMGFEHVKIARYVEVGLNQTLSMENLDHNISVATHNALSSITDSAAAATAIATGFKTFNRRIAIGTDGSELKTILEIAQEKNKSTGVITTTSIQHATPACFMTHVMSRSDYNEITRQIVENANVDILLGGGLDDFTAQQIEEMENNSYSYVTNKTALEVLSNGKILGLFANGHLGYEQDRNVSLIPSLKDMTRKAIEILDQNSNGFFLMVEGGRIDHGSHDNNIINAILQTIEFNLAIREAINYVKSHENSILIVTADHETGGLKYISNNFDDILPSSLNTEMENRTIRINRINQLDISWSSSGHTYRNVPFYALGKVFERIESVSLIDNTNIFDVMNDFIEGKGIEFQSVLPVKIKSPVLIISLISIGDVILLTTIISRILKRKN